MPDAKLYPALNWTALETVRRLIYTQTILVICNLLDTNDWHQHQIVFLRNVDFLLCFYITVICNMGKVLTFAAADRRECISRGFVVRALSSACSRLKTGALFNHRDTHYRGQIQGKRVGLCNKTNPSLHPFCSFTCWSLQIQTSA